MLLWHADRLRAQMQLHAGQLETAGQRFDALWAESQRMRLTTGYMHYSAQRAALNHARTGRRLDASIRALPDVPKWVAALPLFQCQRIAMAIELGDVALARSEFLTLADNGFAQVIGDTNGLYCLARLSLVAATLCEYDAALLLRRLLEPYETLIAVSALALSIGSVARYLGVLEHCLQRRSEAQHYFERAIESNARTGHELERLSASLDLAGLLAESGNEHDRARAQQLAAAVAEAAGRCGALMLSESALELGLQLTAAQRRRSGVPVPAKSIRTRARAPKLSRQ
jgi:tetratricopeptide (TPR) repeat protein